MGTPKNILSAFNVDHAARITGLTKSRLTRWDKHGFFSPEYTSEEDRGKPYARVYSFSDLVGLKTLKILSDDHNVPLSELRKAAIELKKRSSRPWSEIPLAVLKRKVVFDLDTKPRNVTDGQFAVKQVIELGQVEEDVRNDATDLGQRTKEQLGKVERRRFVVHNAEVFAGTRIPVAAIKEFIEAGYSDRAIIAEYPTLTSKDIETIRKNYKSVA